MKSFIVILNSYVSFQIVKFEIYFRVIIQVKENIALLSHVLRY